MRRLFRGVWNACYFLVCFAQIPLLAGHYLLGDSLTTMALLAAILPLSFIVSLLPGKVGGGARPSEQPVVQRTRGGDPDPDRNLRNEALPLPQRRAFPLRAAVCLLAAAGVAAVIFLLPMFAEVWWVRRLILALILAAMLPLALRTAALRSGESGSVLVGMVAYMAAGVFAYVEKNPQLDRRLMLCGLLFVVMTAFTMNDDSTARSAAYREGVKPPASMRRRNRVLLCIVLAIGVIVLCFDQIRQATVAAVQWVFLKFGALIAWLAGLIPVPESTGGGGAGGGEADMLAGLGGGETGAFWAATENILMVIGLLVGLMAALFILRKLWRLLAKLIRRIAAHLRKFSDSVSEEYQDERESLFDWDEAKREMGDQLRRRLVRMTRREKKWEQMDARERVRFVVRSLYRKSPSGGSLRSLTVHEALGKIKTGQASPEELAAVYDGVRYGKAEPDAQTVERLRKEARV